MNSQGGRPRSGPGGVVGVLHVVGGNDRGKQYLLVNPTTQIGRGADQDFVLADIAVSRRHVQIGIEGNRYRLRDLGSGNGTLVNGQRAATSLLNDGDQIEIGNTLLRFDHPPSSARPSAVVPVAAPPVPQVTGEARTMIAEAPQIPAYAPPPAAPPPAAPTYAPPPPAYAPPAPVYSPTSTAQQDAIPRTSLAMPAPQIPMDMVPARSGMDPKKLAIFGGVGLLLLAGVGFGAMKLMGGGNKAKADQVYADATRAFQSGDYEGAKKLFGEAISLDPANKLYPKQFKQCDVEIHARAALKVAQAMAADKRWEDEFKALDSIDKSAVAYEDVEKLRKQAIPAAVAQYLAEAKESLESDPEAARKAIEAASALDPDNADARELGDKLRGNTAAANAPVEKTGGAKGSRSGGSRPASRPATVAVAAAPEPAPAPARPAAAPARPAAAPAADSKSVKFEPVDDAPAGGFDLLTSKGAAAYKAKDFAGAATQVKNQAKTLKGPAQQKATDAAAQVQKLGEVYARAEADAAKNPVAAVNGYTQAATLDAAVGKGTHKAYFNDKAARLAKDAAKAAFAKQDYPSAFEMSKVASRFGDDGGVGAQLRAKAKELNTQAASQAKSNPNGAKTLWRTVLRMVPSNDPAYTVAQKGLSTAATPAKDEDED